MEKLRLYFQRQENLEIKKGTPQHPPLYSSQVGFIKSNIRAFA